jgi:hypothetical protein
MPNPRQIRMCRVSNCLRLPTLRPSSADLVQDTRGIMQIAR